MRQNIVPMARALTANRSCRVVVKRHPATSKRAQIRAGNPELQAQGRTVRVDAAAGAEAIMKAVDGCGKASRQRHRRGRNTSAACRSTCARPWPN